MIERDVEGIGDREECCGGDNWIGMLQENYREKMIIYDSSRMGEG